MKNIIIVLFVLVSKTLFSQVGDVNKIIPLSPNTAAFARYGEIPVSNFTGTANVSIPIYTIQTKEFNLPLALSYHTGGNRVEDVASWVGLGWSMGTIPMISRSVKGMPDEGTGGFMSKFLGHTVEELYFLPQDDQKRRNFLNALKEGIADSEPDVFNFNILGKSGKFIYDQQHNKFVTLEESQVKISYDNGSFTLVTEEGYEYLFSEPEVTSSNGDDTTTGWYVSRISSPNKNENILFDYDLEVQTLKTLTPRTKLIFTGGVPSDTGVLTSGPITTISTVHANLIKKISFNSGTVEFTRDTNERLDLQGGYSLKTVKVKNLNGQEVFKYDFEYKFINGTNCYSNETYTNKWMLLEKFKNTSSVQTPIGHSFLYDESSIPPCRNSQAQDYWGYYNGANDNLNLIPTVFYKSQVIDGADRFVNPNKTQFAILKKIVYPTGGYTEFYFENNISNSVKLPDIYVDDFCHLDENSTTGLESSYVKPFTINNPPEAFLNRSNPLGGAYADIVMGCDGYELKEGIADANVNFRLIKEAAPGSPESSFYISRSSGKYYLQNGDYRLVASINPPGGEDLTIKSIFVLINWKKLNPNTTPENTNRYIGGLRVAEIRSYADPLSLPIVKRYKYTEAYDSPISSGKVFSEPNFVFEDDVLLGDGDCDGGFCAGSYHRLKSYSNVQQISYSGSTLGYETVIEESNDPAKTGVTIYKYSHSMDNVDNRFPYPPPISMELYRGQPKEITHYKKNGEQLVTVEKKEFVYNAEISNAQRSLFENMFAFKIGKFGYFAVGYDFTSAFAIASYEISTSIDLLASEKTTNYFDSENVITTKTYNYEGTNHIQLTSQSSINSTQENQKVKYYYPQDPEMSSQPFVNEFIAGNRLAVILDTKTLKSDAKLSEQLTVYDKSTATSNLLLPRKVYENKGGAAIDLNSDGKITYDLYDEKGNILQYTPENGMPVSIIWGYYKTQPIAKIENAAYSTISSQTISTLQTLSNADNDNCMSGNCTEQLLRNALNDFRIALQDAFVSTYTYDPLVGVTSITDVKGMTSYYEYDNNGRLRFVKDKDLNVLQKYCYNYKGQQTDCGDNSSTSILLYKSIARSGSFTRANCGAGGIASSVVYNQPAGAVISTISQADADSRGFDKFNIDGLTNANANGECTFSNIAKSGSFIKNNCAAGGIGSAVVYSVPAGRHSSTISQAAADAIAQDDVNNNGQAYANTNGECSFSNIAKSGTFTKNNCAVGGIGSNVVYTVPAGKHSSTSSQAAADALAQDDVNNNGQAYANTNGECTFSNIAKSGTFTRNNCAVGGIGSNVVYTVPARRYSSTSSQATADVLAQDDINNNGQAYANTNGSCIFSNIAKSGLFTRNNCSPGGSPASVWYTVPAGRYSSTDSQAAADALAQDDVNNNGQVYANTNGSCTFSNIAKSGLFTRNNCSPGGSPASVWYTVPAGRYSSIDSQAAADALAQDDVNNNGQAFANNDVNAKCTFWNSVQSRLITRNNCEPGGTPASTWYTVPASRYSSEVSQADADAKAQAEINANGQAFANNDANAKCTFWNTVQSRLITRNNCEPGGTPASAWYTVPASRYSSEVSQADADAKVLAEINANGQAFANNDANAKCTFWNTVQSRLFTRNNCAAGGTPDNVWYTVPASRYSSQISQADADDQAQREINTNGQVYANNNANAKCTFYNIHMAGLFTKINCGNGQGEDVYYNVPAGTYSSIVSQQDANDQAQNDIDTNGQTYANNMPDARCTFWNAAQSKLIARNNCAAGGTPGSVWYTVPASKYSSQISKEDANAKAREEFDNLGQAFANSDDNAKCTFRSIARSGSFTRNNCPPGGVASSVVFNQATGDVTSTISQEDANSRGWTKFMNDGQAYANNTACTFIYYNVDIGGIFTKMNCWRGQGEDVYYNVAAGTYSSTVSQQDANDKAQADVDINGQAYAEENGGCYP